MRLIDNFYLYCLLVASSDMWSACELPASVSYRVELAPTELLLNHVYIELQERGVLVPSVHSPLSAFNVTASCDFPISFDMARTCWTMAESTLGIVGIELIDALRDLIRSGPIGERAALRRILIEHECLRGLLDCFRELQIEIDQPMEREILTLIQVRLPNFNPNRFVSMIRSSLSVNISEIRNAQLMDLASMISNLLDLNSADMSLGNISCDEASNAEVQFLRASRFLMPLKFCEVF